MKANAGLTRSYMKRDYAVLGVKGFCMGIADIIPGISGGTIAFLLGIYEELIFSLRTLDGRFLALVLRGRLREALSGVAWRFLASVFTGILTAIILFSKVISWLIQHEPVLLNSFFFGLILATVPIIVRIIKSWTFPKAASMAAAAAATYYFVGLIPLETPQEAWFIFLCGMIAISAMILPGISGAFILVLLGKYQFILNAVNQRELVTIGIFIFGIVVGIVSFVRILGWLFSRYHDLTVTVIAGIVTGSLRKVWPWKWTLETITTSHGKILPIREANVWPAAFNGEVLAAVALMAVGFSIALSVNASPNRKIMS